MAQMRMTSRGFAKSETIFFKAKSKRLADAISIVSPTEFEKSIVRVKKLKGIPSVTKKRALVLARSRAKAQLNRTNLSARERLEMRAISKTPIPDGL